MKKSIGIVTLIDNDNYGNRLQNFALELLLQEIGFECYTISYINNKYSKYSYGVKKGKFRKMVYQWLNTVPNCITETISNVRNDRIAKDRLKRIRIKRFQRFNKEHLSMTSQVTKFRIRSVRGIGKSLDYLVAGSDQVWNPQFGASDYTFLKFIPRQKRLSFAASIGAIQIPVGLEQLYKSGFREMQLLSVRETDAADLIEKLTGRKAQVTLDPTLFISQSVWNQMAQKPLASLPKHYMVSFFLGTVPQKTLDRYEKAYHIPILRLNDITTPEYYTIDPAEFLYIIKGADLVLTDSFHAMVFSLLFQRVFWVFQREDQKTRAEEMFGRMETLFSLFDINRKKDRKDPPDRTPIPMEKWKEVRDIISLEKEKVRDCYIKYLL